MAPRHDWLKLKNEFITGNWVTIADFLRDKEVKANSRARAHTTGWLQERIAYQEQITSAAKEKLVESEVEARVRQSKIARTLQIKGLQGLQDNAVTNAETARKLVVSGLEQERQALDLNSGIKSATQINFTFGKTRLDKYLEGASYEQILELVADLKKERERRTQLSGKTVTEQ